MTRHVPLRSGNTTITIEPSTMTSSSTAEHEVSSEPQSKVEAAAPFDADAYTKPYISFMRENPTVFHAVDAMGKKFMDAGYHPLTERELWKLERGGKYFFTRNGSGLIAFAIGDGYVPGNGAAVIATHIDALTAKVKPVSTKATSLGFERLGVAQYAGALSQTWFDRDLGIGGRVFVKDPKSGKIESKLVKLDWPIARIPTLAPHFGLPAEGQANRETRMVPVIGIDNSDIHGGEKKEDATIQLLGSGGNFVSTQPKRLVELVAGEIGVTDYSSIISWELELFDFQPAQLGGLDKDMIFAGRIDDKLCSFSAVEGLIASSNNNSGVLKVVGLFDDEEIGSLTRQGANSNFLSSTIERICESFSEKSCTGTLYQTYANSFLLSADVCHSFNPNYADLYLPGHAPRLNIGVAVHFDSNAHLTTDAASYSLLQEVARRSDSVLQRFQIRNDSRGGGTVGPMLSARTGMRAIDAGIPQLSMHSIRATTGRLDPGLGVKLFKGFYDYFEEVDKEFA